MNQNLYNDNGANKVCKEFFFEKTDSLSKMRYFRLKWFRRRGGRKIFQNGGIYQNNFDKNDRLNYEFSLFFYNCDTRWVVNL
jgi:hypothetical protein